jgi:hypothetical protein
MYKTSITVTYNTRSEPRPTPTKVAALWTTAGERIARIDAMAKSRKISFFAARVRCDLRLRAADTIRMTTANVSNT